MNDPLKPLRKSFRAWKNLHRIEREKAYYRSVFKKRNLVVPDDGSIMQAIRSKFPSLNPVSIGDFRILAIYYQYNWENESLRPALDTFGSVRVYDWPEKYDHRKKEWNAYLKAEMNRDLLGFVGRWAKEGDAHLIFAYLSGELVSPQTVKELSAFGIPMVNLALNDKEAFVGKIRGGLAMGSRDICRHFDLCWTSTRDALVKYSVEGALPVFLPEGANPEVHRPYDLEKTFDVTFVGQRYGNRPEVIDALASAGIRVEAFGPGWPNGPLSTEDMVKMYSRSRINLGFGGVAGHRDTYCLKGRDFEVPMSGGLYLTEYHEELSHVYELEREIVTYNGIEDLISKIRRLLSDPEEADRIRKNGLARALREHTWESRFRKIFGLLGILNEEAAQARRPG